MTRVTRCACSKKPEACACPNGGTCEWPKGCTQRHVGCCGSSDSGRHDLCAYHDSIVAGSIEVGPGHGRWGVPAIKGVSRADVVSDERREIEEIIRVLRAS